MIIEIIKAVVIGVVEGITEWLPISSTGHMIIVDEFISLDVSPGFMALFLVVIQLGAIMAVILLYLDRLNPFKRNQTASAKGLTWQLWAKVLVASIPAAAIGLALDDWFEQHMMNAVVVAVALIVYGVAFILIERRQANTEPASQRLRRGLPSHSRPARGSTRDGLDKLTWAQAVGIGCFQCLAIVPGTSRSGSTIIGGRLLGVPRQAAAEFSFFLAIPVMLGWSLLKVVKAFVLDHLAVGFDEWLILLTGIVVAFAVSVLAIRFLIGYIQNNSFALFGWYRIILGVTVLAYFALTGGLA